RLRLEQQKHAVSAPEEHEQPILFAVELQPQHATIESLRGSEVVDVEDGLQYPVDRPHRHLRNRFVEGSMERLHPVPCCRLDIRSAARAQFAQRRGGPAMDPLVPLIPRTHIASYSMEIALEPEMHTYSGGLGVLAGDTVRSCADLELLVVFVTLVSRAGYLRQEIDAEGRQIDHPDPWEVAPWAQPLGAKIAVPIE